MCPFLLKKKTCNSLLKRQPVKPIRDRDRHLICDWWAAAGRRALRRNQGLALTLNLRVDLNKALSKPSSSQRVSNGTIGAFVIATLITHTHTSSSLAFLCKHRRISECRAVPQLTTNVSTWFQTCRHTLLLAFVRNHSKTPLCKNIMNAKQKQKLLCP